MHADTHRLLMSFIGVHLGSSAVSPSESFSFVLCVHLRPSAVSSFELFSAFSLCPSACSALRPLEAKNDRTRSPWPRPVLLPVVTRGEWATTDTCYGLLLLPPTCTLRLHISSSLIHSPRRAPEKSRPENNKKSRVPQALSSSEYPGRDDYLPRRFAAFSRPSKRNAGASVRAGAPGFRRISPATTSSVEASSSCPGSHTSCTWCILPKGLHGTVRPRVAL